MLTIRHNKLKFVIGNDALPSANNPAPFPCTLIFADNMGDFIDGACSPVDQKMRNRYVLGDDNLAEKARAFMASVASVPVSTSKRLRAKDVVGGGVSIGAALSGSPKAFRRRKIQTTPLGPLTIVVGQSPSMGIEREQMLNRGLAITALAQKLSPVRQVSVYTSASCASWKGLPIMAFAKIPTNSAGLLASAVALDFVYRGPAYDGMFKAAARAALSMPSEVTTGRISSTVASNMTSTQFGGAGWIMGKSSGLNYEQKANYSGSHKSLLHDDLRKFFGHDVIFFPHNYLSQPDSILMMSNPKAWLAKMLAAMSGDTDD